MSKCAFQFLRRQAVWLSELARVGRNMTLITNAALPKSLRTRAVRSWRWTWGRASSTRKPGKPLAGIRHRWVPDPFLVRRSAELKNEADDRILGWVRCISSRPPSAIWRTSQRGRCGSCISSIMVSAIIRVSPKGTIRPVRCCSITSGMPPTQGAMLGNEKNIPSNILRQKLSFSEA